MHFSLNKVCIGSLFHPSIHIQYLLFYNSVTILAFQINPLYILVSSHNISLYIHLGKFFIFTTNISISF